MFNRHVVPDMNCTRFFLLAAEQKTPSPCPSSAPTNGLANILSSFTAVSARVYSRAFKQKHQSDITQKATCIPAGSQYTGNK